MTSHFTAWLTTARDCLSGSCADVVVLADEKVDGADDKWMSTGDPLMHAVTTVEVPGGDHEAAMLQAEQLLTDTGWVRVGRWDDVPTGYTVTVARS